MLRLTSSHRTIFVIFSFSAGMTLNRTQKYRRFSVTPAARRSTTQGDLESLETEGLSARDFLYQLRFDIGAEKYTRIQDVDELFERQFNGLVECEFDFKILSSQH